MRKFTYIIGFLLVFLSSVVNAQVNTWQAQQGYVANIQAQLNNIQQQINSFLLPPSATAGQFVVENPAGTAYVAATISGDVSSSITTAGKLTVVGLDTKALCAGATSPTSGQALVYNGTQWCPALGGGGSILDLCSNGFACNAQIDTGATWTDGTTGIVGSLSLFKATDCNISHGGGCTGTADKLFGLYNNFNSLQFGTIVGFTDSNHVAANASLSTGVSGGSVIWANDDAAAMTALMVTIGATTNIRSARLSCHAPIMTSTTLTIGTKKDIEFAGTGMFTAWTDNINTQNTCLIIDASTTPDIPVVKIEGNIGTWFHDVGFAGETTGTSSPPSSFIDLSNHTGTNIQNRIERVSNRNNGFVSGVGAIGGNCTMTGDHSGGDTSIALTAGCNSALPDLGPNMPVWFIDGTAGWEIRYTSNSYVRGSNPVVLKSGLTVAHTAVNTVVDFMRLYTSATGITWDDCSGCTQDDTQIVSQPSWSGVGVAEDQRQQQSVNNTIFDAVCLQCGIGLSQPNGGAINVIGDQLNNSSLGYYLNGGNMIVTNFSPQPVIGITAGTEMLALIGPAGGRLNLINSDWAQNSQQPTNGDFLMIGPAANPVDVLLSDLNLGRSSGLPAITQAQVSPQIEAFIGGAQSLSFSGTYHVSGGGVAPMNLLYKETGSGISTTLRAWNVCEMSGSKVNSQYMCSKQVLRGSDTWNHWQNMEPGAVKDWDISVPVIAAPTTPIAIPNAACANTNEDFYYWATAVVNGHESALSGRSTVQSCKGDGAGAAQLDSGSNNLTINVLTAIGGQQVNLYCAAVNHGAGAPASSTATLCYTNDYNISTLAVGVAAGSANNVGFWDNGTGAGGAAPPLAGNTGQINAGGLITGTGGVVNGCTWTCTMSAGACTAASVPCLANFSHVAITSAGGGGGATTIATPANTPAVYSCAQPSAKATSVNCAASTANATPVINGTGY